MVFFMSEPTPMVTNTSFEVAFSPLEEILVAYSCAKRSAVIHKVWKRASHLTKRKFIALLLLTIASIGVGVTFHNIWKWSLMVAAGVLWMALIFYAELWDRETSQTEFRNSF